jgi:hypothetical protein
MDLKALHGFVKRDGIVFLTYGGFLSQTLISGMTEALEKEAEYNELGMGLSNNIFTIFIELSQNMMKYNSEHQRMSQFSEGLIIVGKTSDNKYYIISQNIISKSDAASMNDRLKDVVELDKESLKKKYRELRRSGRDRHHKGAGIGFYEIAKRSDKIEYDFVDLDENTSFFTFKASVGQKI